MKHVLFNVLVVIGMICPVGSWAEASVCDKTGLAPMPGKSCSEMEAPEPPDNKCKRFVLSGSRDEGKLSEEEFRHLLSYNSSLLSMCSPLLTKKQKEEHVAVADAMRKRIRSEMHE